MGISFEMAWTDSQDWWALFAREHLSPKKFVEALQDPDSDVEDDSFDPYSEYVRSEDVKVGWWWQRPVTDADECDSLQWIYEECNADQAGAFPCSWLPL